jgi:hypothetical protein
MEFKYFKTRKTTTVHLTVPCEPEREYTPKHREH